MLSAALGDFPPLGPRGIADGNAHDIVGRRGQWNAGDARTVVDPGLGRHKKPSQRR